MHEEEERRSARAKAHYQEWLWSHPDLDFASAMAAFAAAEVHRLESLRPRPEPAGFRLSLEKGLEAAAICRDLTDGSPDSVRTALFLAEAWHIRAYGRPLYGDRWTKAGSGPIPFALREATGKRRLPAIPRPADRDSFSRSDEEKISAACSAVAEGRAARELAAIACWQAADPGTYVPLAAVILEGPGGDGLLTRALEDAHMIAY